MSDSLTCGDCFWFPVSKDDDTDDGVCQYDEQFVCTRDQPACLQVAHIEDLLSDRSSE